MRRLVLVALLVGACGESEDEPAMCADRSGVYRVSYSVESGDCPPLPDTVADLTPGGPTDASCTGRQTASTNGCELTTDLSCKLDSGAMSRVTGILKCNESGSSCKGTLSIRLEGVCNGLYKATYTKL